MHQPSIAIRDGAVDVGQSVPARHRAVLVEVTEGHQAQGRRAARPQLLDAGCEVDAPPAVPVHHPRGGRVRDQDRGVVGDEAPAAGHPVRSRRAVGLEGAVLRLPRAAPDADVAAVVVPFPSDPDGEPRVLQVVRVREEGRQIRQRGALHFLAAPFSTHMDGAVVVSRDDELVPVGQLSQPVIKVDHLIPPPEVAHVSGKDQDVAVGNVRQIAVATVRVRQQHHLQRDGSILFFLSFSHLLYRRAVRIADPHVGLRSEEEQKDGDAADGYLAESSRDRDELCSAHPHAPMREGHHHLYLAVSPGGEY
mmetsp:Transcript_59/g.161  ORF Transcript_59/g.161 Transcript_59/m.161 type:complete len:307 (-) Transcript_59:7-927(-)